MDYELETDAKMKLVGIDDGEDVDPELLTGIYERVRACEFQPSTDHVLQVAKVEQMILGKKPVCIPPFVVLFYFICGVAVCGNFLFCVKFWVV